MPRSRSNPRPAWTRLSDEQLLRTRFCDLDLSIERSRLKGCLSRLHRELESRGVKFKPHAWLSEEWFSPDGTPGIAIPFYLAHPRLERLERRIMREVEGGNTRWLMRILRHEAGHAIDTAYRLRRRKCWREVFGRASTPYPDRYRARPGSRRYVQHLGGWYAQAHPAEDFAETFAVWLKPNSNWRRSYAEWPALHKLRLVESLLAEVRDCAAPVRNRARIEPIEHNKRTLAQHYRLKLARYGRYRRGLADELLQKIFIASPPRPDSMRAATLLRALRTRTAAAIARDLELEHYTVRQILRMLIDRATKLDLHVAGSRRDAVRRSRWLLAHLSEVYSRGATPQLSL